jgi:hypothetical protein
MAKSFKVQSDKPIAGLFKCFTSGKTFTLQAMVRNKDFQWTDDPKGRKFNFRASDLPENVSEGFRLKNGSKYHCRITEDEELLDIRPAVGSFIGRFKGLAENRDGGIFVDDKDGKYGPYSQFVAEIEVTKGPFKGIVYPKYIIFTSYDKKNKEVVPLFGEDDGELTYGATKQLEEFFEFSGLADPKVAVKYDDDLQELLTNISRKLGKLNNLFNFSVENGYPAALTSYEDWDDEDSDDEEDVDEDTEEDEVEEVVEEAPKKKKQRSFDD